MSLEFLRIRNARPRAVSIGVVLTATLLFWGLRATYWSSVEEQPFSDMANFDATARGIATAFNFQWSDFWRSYSTPSLVTARALQIVLFGDSMLAWRIFQAGLTFVGLAWLALELFTVTRSRWIAGALLLMVALSKPSIFWSLKLSREGLHEAATYFCVAAALYALRRPSAVSYVALGALLAVNFLNRPNGVLLVPLLALIVVGVHWSRQRAAAPGLGPKLMALGAGVAILWGPWIARSVLIYGEPVLFSTQAPYTFLWELGEVRVRLEDGTEIRTDVNRLQKEAPGNFPNDLAASRYASQIASAWISQNLAQLPLVALRRINNTVAGRQVYLTRVPRDRLFGRPFDDVLLDKSPTKIYAGSLGLVLFAALYRWHVLVLAAAVLVPWLSGAALLSYPRMLEAAIPLILFGNVAWIVLLARGLQRLRGSHGSRFGTTQAFGRLR